jgi:HK97 gp10 family phage protein
MARRSQLVSNLTKIAQSAPEFAKEALLLTAADIVGVAKQLAPVLTGALKQSLGAAPVSSKEIHIGSDMPYAPFQEFGTGDMAAQPFLIPAFTQSEDTFKLRLKQAAEKALPTEVPHR